MDPTTILAMTAAVGAAATVFAGGVANILGRIEARALAVAVDVPEDRSGLCNSVHGVSGARCDLAPHERDVRHFDIRRNRKWGDPHTVAGGAR